MKPPVHRGAGAGADVAAALVDARGVIVWWSRAATELLGWTGDEATGRPARAMIAAVAPGRTADGPYPHHRLWLRDSRGGTVEAEVRLLSSDWSPWSLVIAAPPGPTSGWEQGSALARSFLHQDLLAVAEFDLDLRVLHTNLAFDILRPGNAGDDWLLGLRGVTALGTAGEAMARVAEGGTAVVGAEYRLGPPGFEVAVALNCFPIHDRFGVPAGVAVTVAEITERNQAHTHRLVANYRNTFEIGDSLDVVHNARELVDVLVPVLGDLACVDFSDDVLQGRDPPLGYPGMRESAPRRVAVKSAEGAWPQPLVQVGEPIPFIPDRETTAAIAVGGAFVVPPELSRELLSHDPHLIARMNPEGTRSTLVCPLYHRSRLFGNVLVWRTRNPAPFDDSDVKLLQDLCDRTAVALDNAFRYTREHRTAITLQRSLLPPAATVNTACETAGTYLPAGASTSVGGDWFDVIPLSSLRVALVVGDVIGHGLQATATMARLRTAVQTLADLDLPPDELLIRLDDLVQRMKAEADQSDTLGASCLIAVYDPVSRICQVTSAGHPPPALVLPDTDARYLDLSPGPLLGVGDHPFEVSSVTLPPGSVLALYTDGVTGRDAETGMAWLLGDLDRLCRSGRSLEQIGADLITRHPGATDRPDDDVTLLLARTSAVREDHTAAWQYPADPTAVRTARADVNAQLATWGLDEHMFATELVVSELVTNAIRYAGGPIGLRLIRDRVLVCEVSDPSNSQPRLRHALDTDEGGRGMFLIAQLTTRWGCRYASRGKTIWTEQSLTDS